MDCSTSLRNLDLPRRGEYNPSMELDGKIVVVTGASMGIGEALTKIFVAQGASVVMLSRDTGRAEAARTRIGCPERTVALSCDVRNSEEIDRVLALTLHHFKRVDIWINNAGHGLFDPVAQTDMQACHELFETNFFGAMSAMQVVIPVMKQQGAGAIINISSVAGHIPLPFHASYSATKFCSECHRQSRRSRTQEGWRSRADGLSGLRADSLQRECNAGKRIEESSSGVRSRDHSRARRPRHSAGILEAEAGGGRALDYAHPRKVVSALSQCGGMGDVQDGKVSRVRTVRVSNFGVPHHLDEFPGSILLQLRYPRSPNLTAGANSEAHVFPIATWVNESDRQPEAGSRKPDATTPYGKWSASPGIVLVRSFQITITANSTRKTKAAW